MKKCIGIISWLPDDPTLRQTRLNSLNKTLSKVFKLFDLPVIIIAQNWQDSDINLNDNCIIYRYDKLGILNARKKLREKFLESEYEYLIMLDDDCYIEGTSADTYLKFIDAHPDSCVRVHPTQLKLFAISKALYSEFDMVDCDPEQNFAYEDSVFLELLAVIHYNKFFKLPPDKAEIYVDVKKTFKDSTWSTGKSAKVHSTMRDNSRNYISTYLKKYRERTN